MTTTSPTSAPIRPPAARPAQAPSDVAHARRIDRGLDQPRRPEPPTETALAGLRDEVRRAQRQGDALLMRVLALAIAFSNALEQRAADDARYGVALTERERRALLRALDAPLGADAIIDAGGFTPGPRAMLLEAIDVLQARGVTVSRARLKRAALAGYGAVLDVELDALAKMRGET